MATLVISFSSNSSEESVGTSTARVILFGVIPTTISSIVPTADSPTIPPISPTIQFTSPFVCTDSSSIDTHDIPPPPIQDTPPAEITPSTRQILPAPPRLPHEPAFLVLPEQPIPVGRPYRTQSNGITLHGIISPQMTHLETSSDSHSDTLSDSSSRQSSSGHPISDCPCDSPASIFARLSRKRCRSPTISVPVASLVPRALSPIHADLLPPYKRIRDSDSVTDFEVSSEEDYVPHVPREIGLGVNVEDNYEPYTEPDIDPDVHADIDACIAFADDIAARGTDVRVEVGTTAEDEAESSKRGTIEIGVDQVTHPVVSDATVEPVREDYLDLVSADGSLDVSYAVELADGRISETNVIL
ncbi:hypothetical protein Tco_0835608 [Tanacetum coccineum]